MSALCLPHAWLQFFDDPLLVMVLAAHAEAPETPEGFRALSERECVAVTRIDRKTVRKKKHELIERYRVLAAAPIKRGAQWLCRLDWERLNQLVEKRGEVGEISPSEWGKKGPVVGEKGTSDWGKKGPVVGEICPTPETASLLPLASSRKLAVKTPEEKLLEEAVREAIGRSRLQALGGETLDDWTVGNLVAALLPIAADVPHVKAMLDLIEDKCRDYARHPAKAKSWGMLVSVLRKEINLLLRKPPGREEAFDVSGFNAQLHALGASKGMR